MRRKDNPRQLGMKWYTFYIDIRPWLTIVLILVNLVTLSEDFLLSINHEVVGTTNAILNTIYLVCYIAYGVLCITLLAKKSGEATSFLAFLEFFIPFECVFVFCGALLAQYRSGTDLLVMAVLLPIVCVVGYFLWRINIRYFRRRLAPLMAEQTAVKPKHSLSPESQKPDNTQRTSAVWGEDLILKANEASSTSEETKGQTDLGAQQQQHEQGYVNKTVFEKRPVRYCSKCGYRIDPDTKKCTGCGKQYFKGIPWKTLSFVTMVILLILSYGMNVSQYFELSENQKTIKELKKETADLKNEVRSINSKLSSAQKELEFFDEYVVFVEDDGTGEYHKSHCFKFERDSFWALNTDAANAEGLTPCAICCQGKVKK